MDKFEKLSEEFLEFVANELMKCLEDHIGKMDGSRHFSTGIKQMEDGSSKPEGFLYKSDRKGLEEQIEKYFRLLTNEQIGFSLGGTQCIIKYGERFAITNTPYWLKIHCKGLWNENIY